MIKIFQLLFLVFYSFQTNAQLDFYYLNDWHYKGNPKNVVISTFSVQKDSIYNELRTIQRKEVQVDKYNEFGKCSSHQWQNLEAEIIKEFRFNYDHNGKRFEFIIFDQDSVLRERYLTILDSNQNEIRHEIYDSKDELISSNVTETIMNDSVKTTLTKDIMGGLISKEISIFDSLKREIQELNYYEKLKFSRETLFKYNNDGKLVESTTITSGVDTFMTTYRYDSLGRNIELNRYDMTNERPEFSMVTVYLDNINQQEFYSYDYGLLTYRSLSYLDSNDCILRQIEHRINHPTLLNRLKHIQDFETETWYEYDQRLNWIRKTEFADGVKTSIQERNFEYY